MYCQIKILPEKRLRIIFVVTFLAFTSVCCSLGLGLITVPNWVALTTLTQRLDKIGSFLRLCFDLLRLFKGEGNESDAS